MVFHSTGLGFSKAIALLTSSNLRATSKLILQPLTLRFSFQARNGGLVVSSRIPDLQQILPLLKQATSAMTEKS